MAETQTDHASVKLNERERILANLAQFIRQRPGMQYGNYCSGWHDKAGRAAYFSEARSVAKDLRQARELLAAVSWRSSIDAEALKTALRGAYSGRLTWDGRKLAYCTGQYFATEYRRAVCAVLASALWSYWRENMPEPVTKQYGDKDNLPMQTVQLYDGLRAGDWIRRQAKRELGAPLAKRWFN